MWKEELLERKEELEADLHDIIDEKCPFTPSLTNKSRSIMAKRGDKIRERHKEKHIERSKIRKQAIIEEEEAQKRRAAERKISEAEIQEFYKRVVDWTDNKDKMFRDKVIDKLLQDQEEEKKYQTIRGEGAVRSPRTQKKYFE